MRILNEKLSFLFLLKIQMIIFLQGSNLGIFGSPRLPALAWLLGDRRMLMDNRTFGGRAKLRAVVQKVYKIFNFINMEAFMYILQCGNGLYYVGSTTNMEKRLEQHQLGEGSNFTKKHLPVKLVYFETFDRIDEAFEREKQVQNWSRAKKEALINRDFQALKELSKGN